MVQFPPRLLAVRSRSGTVRLRFGAVRGGVAPKVQTTSVKNADNGVSWARWSALWSQRRLASCVARTRTRYSVR